MSDLIENGRYRARAIDAVLGVADTGTKQVAVLFDLLDHPGHAIAWYGYFTEKTEERTIESLIHAGWTGDNLASLDGLGSTEVQLVVEHEQNQKGEVIARVKWVNAAGAGALVKTEMDVATRLQFAEQMRGKAIQIRQRMAQKLPRSPVAPGVDPDADSPF
jgi:hypothetical protein